jgi:energy-coupling factor transporter ATP-binding protein EcfA2
LDEHIDKALYMLSTGSKRKVWIAAAIASGAEVILIDDPFAALDKPSIRFITQLLQEASKLSTRAWVISGYEAPEGVNLAQLIDLGD